MQAKAKLSCIDYSLHMAVTKWDQRTSDAMGKLVAKVGSCQCSRSPCPHTDLVTLWEESKESLASATYISLLRLMSKHVMRIVWHNMQHNMLVRSY